MLFIWVFYRVLYLVNHMKKLTNMHKNRHETTDMRSGRREA